jgi:hypothetical protein
MLAGLWVSEDTSELSWGLIAVAREPIYRRGVIQGATRELARRNNRDTRYCERALELEQKGYKIKREISRDRTTGRRNHYEYGRFW